MNKQAIKRFATGARKKLMAAVTQKAHEVGVTREAIKKIEIFPGGFRVNGCVFKEYELKQREVLVELIQDKGFDQVVEEVAYTWFNRFIALRFMEVNDYLPTGVRVLSSREEKRAGPDIVREALNLDPDIEHEFVSQGQDSHDTEGLYKHLLIKQCNYLGKIMPDVFEEIADYMELLIPNGLLAESSVIKDLVHSIEEDDFKQAEIIGWFYQFYNQEKRDYIFDSNLSNRKKIQKDDIPAATQVFTPKWIVQFIVQNSLGRLWLESHPGEEIKVKWQFYVETVERETEGLERLDELKNPGLNPEHIKVLDPATGSGHILVYAFDLLYDIYLNAGYAEMEIPALILEKNLYGLEIDARASQLASFALLMKARSKNRRLFRQRIKLNICTVHESNSISQETVDYFVSGDTFLNHVKDLVALFRDAREYGSILEVKPMDFDPLERRLEAIKKVTPKDSVEHWYRKTILDTIPFLIQQAKIMSRQYDVVVANPPYMGNHRMNERLKEYAKKYDEAKRDLFSIFIKKSMQWTNEKGFIGLVTPYVWWFLPTYEKLRKNVLKNTGISTLVQLEYNAFEGATIPVGIFVLRNRNVDNDGIYFRLSDFKGINNQSQKVLEGIANPSVSYRYDCSQNNFLKIPGSPFAFWLRENMINCFEKGTYLEKKIPVKKGMDTGNNDKYLRLWYEVAVERLGLYLKSEEEMVKLNKKWVPYNKGGKYRKWFGNNEYVVNWENRGEELKRSSANLRSKHLYFKDSITWNALTSNTFSARLSNYGALFDSAGSSMFPPEDKMNYYLALMNTKLVDVMLNVMNPTLNYGAGTVGKLPVIDLDSPEMETEINDRVEEIIKICKDDWDARETSWDFSRHPLLTVPGETGTLEQAFIYRRAFTEERFKKLKQKEEEINRIFINIYGLQEELTPEVDDLDVIINKADRERDIKSFISYAVGCMFGRYSLDEEGLVYAGGNFDPGRYKIFKVDEDNIIPITGDVYFHKDKDIVNRLVDFVKLTFGEESLEENLDYIAASLKRKSGETSRQAIRRYFFSSFYKDHVRMYKQRPIYWLFSSGRQKGFQALIYMHRYDSHTVARIRTDYLHQLQRKYEAELERMDMLLQSDVSQAEKNKARKKKEALGKQLKECTAYDQAIAHVANQRIELDLDEGVKVNYAKFQGSKQERFLLAR